MEGASSREQVAQSESATYFTVEQFSKLNSYFEEGAVEEVTIMIKQKLAELDKIEVNIAVTGESGTGKSTFINAMRGLQNNDDGAAKTGVTETTMEPTRYPHPKQSKVSYWDLPGIGTVNFPAGEYLKEMKFERYDFFIIISAGRFKENEGKLAEEIKQLGKKFYFVRTKIDVDFYSLSKGGSEINEEKMLHDIRSDCRKNLQVAKIVTPSVFLISSFEKTLYDFNRLSKTLEDDLPHLKKHIFVLSYANKSVEIVQRKSKIMQGTIWMWAIASGIVGAIPIPGLSLAYDLSIVNNRIIYFREFLGLDEASLQRLASITNKPVEELKAVVNPLLLGEINKDTIGKSKWGNSATDLSALEVGLKFIPLIGSIFGASSSFLLTNTILTEALKDLTECAERVVKVAYDID